MSAVVYLPAFTLTVPGEPRPKGRPRAKAGQQPFTPRATRNAEKAVVTVFRSAYEDWTPIAKSTRLRLQVVFHRQTYRRVDTDNLVKLVTDALNGVAYEDDESLVETHSLRIYGAGDAARTVLVVSRIEGGDPDLITQFEGDQR